MERMSVIPAITLPPVGASVNLASAWERLRPLRGYAVLGAAIFLVTLVAVVVRLQVQRLEIDLDYNDRAQRSASVLHERLTLELRARRRLQAVQGYAASLGANGDAAIVAVDGGAR
jgi:hypothetical protein